LKKLISINDIKQKYQSKCKVLYIEPNTIITPAAKDLAIEYGIDIKHGKEEICASEYQDVNKEVVNMEQLVKNNLQDINITEDLVSHIVQEVIKSLNLSNTIVPQLKKECDPSGIRLVRGDSVICDNFDTGNPKDKVGIKEILNIKECPNMATGFMEIEKSSFDWTLGYDELDYIVEGTLDITINNKTYRGHAGDVFFIPMNTSITFSSPDYCKFFFSTYPANWQDLCGEKK
jgi:ethanolamine utilization protein EutQ